MGEEFSFSAKVSGWGLGVSPSPPAEAREVGEASRFPITDLRGVPPPARA